LGAIKRVIKAFIRDKRVIFLLLNFRGVFSVIIIIIMSHETRDDASQKQCLPVELDASSFTSFKDFIQNDVERSDRDTLLRVYVSPRELWDSFNDIVHVKWGKNLHMLIHVDSQDEHVNYTELFRPTVLVTENKSISRFLSLYCRGLFIDVPLDTMKKQLQTQLQSLQRVCRLFEADFQLYGIKTKYVHADHDTRDVVFPFVC
jgi:hypothetical protein